MLLYTPRERIKLLRFACQRRVSAVNTSGRGTVFASEFCPPTIKLPRLISWKAFRAFYDGGQYSLVNNVRGDIIHGGTVFTPTPG